MKPVASAHNLVIYVVIISNDENMFVSYSYLSFDGILNASLFDLYSSSFVSSILYKSAFIDLKLSVKASTLITVPSYSRH